MTDLSPLFTPEKRRIHAENVREGEARMAAHKHRMALQEDHSYGKHKRFGSPFCLYCKVDKETDRIHAAGALTEAIAGIWSREPAPKGFRKAKGIGR